jgi:N-acetylglucosamine-6-phosphate deacetylase
VAEFERWQSASGGLVGMVTLSPHFPESTEYIRELSSRGIHVAIGHTDASPEQIHLAVEAGATLSTHLGNGIAGVIPRHANVLWPQLAEDRLTATMIADGHHIPDDMLKVMIRAKGTERSILVSDAVAHAGMRPGIYDAAVGGKVKLDSNGRLSLVGTEYLAGAARPLKDGVARLVSMGISLHDSLRMTTENPGRFVGGIGVLRVGAPADLIHFTLEANTLRIHRVIAKGQEWPAEMT